MDLQVREVRHKTSVTTIQGTIEIPMKTNFYYESPTRYRNTEYRIRETVQQTTLESQYPNKKPASIYKSQDSQWNPKIHNGIPKSALESQAQHWNLRIYTEISEFTQE